MTRGDGPHLDRYGNCGDSDKDGFLHLCMTHSGVANELRPYRRYGASISEIGPLQRRELPRHCIQIDHEPRRRHSGCIEWRLCRVAAGSDMDYPG